MRLSAAQKKQRARQIAQYLKKEYPLTQSELHWSNPWELLVAVVLSAQCTDKRVNEVTAKLFKKYPTLDDYLSAKIFEFEKDIFSTGFYRAKTKSILGAAKIFDLKFARIMPRTIPDLMQMPGVARKTANVILGNLFDQYDGIAVDTHVRRLALKFGLTEESHPLKIEKDLVALFEKSDWKYINNGLVLYGRYICKAHPHDCRNHPLTQLFPETADFFACAKVSNKVIKKNPYNFKKKK